MLRVRHTVRVPTGAVRGGCFSAIAALATACTVGPNYRLPPEARVNASAAQGPFLGSKDPSVSGAALPRSWWRLYQDETLDQLVQKALQANTDLRMAEANLQRSQALVQEARSYRQPVADLEGSIEYSQLAGEQYLLRARPPRNTYYDSGITIGYNLDLFGAVRRGIEAASAQSEAVAAARDLVRVNVAAGTAGAYAAVCGAGLELAAAQHSLDLQRENLELTRHLFQGGRAIDLDVTRSQELVEQLRSAIPTLQAAQQSALFRLAALTGQLPEELDPKIGHCAEPPRLRQPLPVGDGTAMLRRRPDIRESERELAAATAEFGVETAQLYPNVVLGIPLGSIGAKPDFLTAPTDYWGLGAQVSWQANQSVTRARIASAKATSSLALAHFDGVVLAAVKEVESALTAYTHDLQREESVRAARDKAARAAQEAQQLELHGRATELTVLDAQRTLAAAEQSLAQTEATLSGDQVSVFLALGGGWEPDGGAG